MAGATMLLTRVTRIAAVKMAKNSLLSNRTRQYASIFQTSGEQK